MRSADVFVFLLLVFLVEKDVFDIILLFLLEYMFVMEGVVFLSCFNVWKYINIFV